MVPTELAVAILPVAGPRPRLISCAACRPAVAAPPMPGSVLYPADPVSRQDEGERPVLDRTLARHADPNRELAVRAWQHEVAEGQARDGATPGARTRA